MAQPAPQPGNADSMEDILHSIKRIIEDDSGEPKPESVAVDVLDLTQAVKPDGTPVAPLSPMPKATVSAAPPPTGDVVQSIDAIFAEEKPAPAAAPAEKPVEPPVAKPAPAAAPAAVKPIAMEDGLVSEQAAQAAAAALKPIAESAQKDYSIPRVASPELRNGNTVEDLVLESLRPMLKAWLDEHLPTIVQKIVEKEVKRIVTFHKD